MYIFFMIYTMYGNRNLVQAYTHTSAVIWRSLYSVLCRNYFRHVEYVQTYMHTYIVIYIYIQLMHHKLLEALVLGASMVCTKHGFSIGLNFRKEGMLDIP